MGERYMKHDVLERILDGSAEPTNLPLRLLQDITGNFSDEREIGRGGFGVVYKGSLQNGIVAVKRALSMATTDDEQFRHEANCLLKVKHQNIVRFLGFCSNTEIHEFRPMGRKTIDVEIRERLLCFEYTSKGSLKKHLTDELRGLEWHTRYQIIKGICEGLRYLHKEKRIIHRDLKPDNVLLDDLMVPKITDFGISKELPDGASTAITTNRSMSLGYYAPEMLRGEVSFRSDIYSLGVIIIEIVTGRNQYDFNVKNVLRRWRHRWNKSGKLTPLEYQQVTKCIEIGQQCQEAAMRKRPSISDIIHDLNKLDSTDGQSGKAHESTVGQIFPDWNDLLGIDPLQLYFSSELNTEISCSVQLSNQTDDYIAFDIQMTSLLEYSTQPDKGVLPPRSKCSVNITLHDPSKAPRDTRYPEFVVQSTKVNEGLTTEDITEDMFDKEVGKEVDEMNLTVVYDAPPLPGEPTVHTGNPNHREASNEPQLSVHVGSALETTSQNTGCESGELLGDMQSVRISEGLELNDITEGMFERREGSVVDETKLKVVFTAPQPSSSISGSPELLGISPTELRFPFELHRDILLLIGRCLAQPTAAEQIYNGSTFHKDNSNYFEENAGPREVRLDGDSQFYRHDNQEYSPDGDSSPGIEGFQIVGEPIPGFTLRACGFPTNGTTLCNFQWVRYLENGIGQSIEGATIYDYVVTADDVGTVLSVDCTPMDDNGRQGELVREFANNQNKITCDSEMQSDIDICISRGSADFDVSVLQGYSDDEWVQAILLLRRTGYQVKFKHTDKVVIGEKYSSHLQTKIPNGRTTQFVLVSSGGVNLPFNTQGITEPNNEDNDVRLRDLIVLVIRTFQNKAFDAERKDKA